MKLSALILCVILLLPITLSASDYAEFVNLGFSENSQYFMFSQYGHDADDVFAECIVVDIFKNDYNLDARSYKKFTGPFPIGQHGFGALLTLLHTNNHLRETYNINHIKTGRIVYIALVDNPKSEIHFRDFASDQTYTIVLTQRRRDTYNLVSSSFSIELTTWHPSEGQRFFRIGNPIQYREGIEGYAIQQIILSPDQRSLVFLIATHNRGEDGISIRYVVETVVIR